MSFRSIVRDVRDGFGSLSRRSFEVRLPGHHHRGKSHGSVHELHDQPIVIQNSRWAGLPPELLRDVIKRLEASETTWPARKNVVACAAVCRSWREMCKEIVRSPEFCGKITFPVSLKQPGPRDGAIQCFIKRDKSNLTYHLFLCLSPALLVENGKFLLSAKRTRRTTCTEYVISMDADNISRSSSTYIGKLRSNFLGTKFILRFLFLRSIWSHLRGQNIYTLKYITMALVVYWYDFVCFGIVAAAFIGSWWVLWRKERASRCDDNTIYESLIASRPDSDGFVRAIPKAYVGSSQLWTSCWKGVHPGWLLLTRFVSLVAMAGFLSWDIADWGASIFVYYTEWTFTLVIIYFGLGTIVSAYGCWVYRKDPPSANGVRDEFVTTDVEESITTNTLTYGENEVRGSIKLQSHYAEEVIQHRAGFWGYLMQTIYQTCGGAVILTDIVFWCIIVPFLSNAHLALNMLMGCMHTLNAVFLLLDSALNNLPFPWFRLAYFVQWSCLYVVFQWVIHACGFSWWPYPFLELNNPWAPLWYFSLAVVHIPCYGIYALIIKAKNRILSRLFPHAFLRSY